MNSGELNYNKDKWNHWFTNTTLDKPGPIGDSITYELGYNFLKDCNEIQDWGCGFGGLTRLIKDEDNIKYIGVDGSNTPFATIKADLLDFKSNTEGIFIRHVLEHNYDWKILLDNACKSFTKKMCLILFIDFSNETRELRHNRNLGIDVPDLSISKSDLLQILEKNDVKYRLETHNTRTQYGKEHIFYLEK